MPRRGKMPRFGWFGRLRALLVVPDVFCYLTLTVSVITASLRWQVRARGSYAFRMGWRTTVFIFSGLALRGSER